MEGLRGRRNLVTVGKELKEGKGILQLLPYAVYCLDNSGQNEGKKNTETYFSFALLL